MKNIDKAMREADRSRFLPEKRKEQASFDQALPIGKGQTISQPTVVRMMLEWLEIESHHKVLEIGSGSGYVLAVLSFLAEEVTGVEIDRDLVEEAKPRLQDYENVTLHCSDGHRGFPAEAPFDRILVSFAFEDPPVHLLDQLKDAGRLVVPVGNTIQVYEKETHHGFAFVPDRTSEPKGREGV